MNCFAGGVFLGTCILHLILESIETIEETGISDGYEALPGVLIGAGFFLVLFLEHIVGKCGGKGSNIFHVNDHNDVMQSTSVTPATLSNISKCQENGSYGSWQKTNRVCDLATVSYQESDIDKTDNKNEQQSHVEPKGINPINMETKFKQENTLKKNAEEDGERNVPSDLNTKLRSLILLLSLSIHMLFEGMAIGLQNTELETWTLLAALSVHKCVVAFGVGLKMKETMSMKKVLIYMLPFASVSPVGVAIGIGISSCGNCGDAHTISEGIMTSVASGVFLYVTFFEILHKELSHNQNYSLLKVFLCFIGFSAMAALKVLD